jgi:hypothetical protein
MKRSLMGVAAPALTAVTPAEQREIVGGSIDLDVPYCGNGWPHWKLVPGSAVQGLDPTPVPWRYRN